jgi:hypothetical protein
MVVFNAVTIIWCICVALSLGFAGSLVLRYNKF